MNQTTRQRITGSLVLALAALILLPVIFDGEGSYLPTVAPEIPARPLQPQPAFEEAERPVIDADSDAIRIRPETTDALVTDTEPPQEQLAADSATQATPTADPVPQDSSSAVTSVQPAPAQPLTTQPAPAPTPPTATTASETASTTPAPRPQSAQTQTAPVQPAAAADNRTAALDIQGLPESWSVRLASFSNAANASALVTRLQDAGHRAYTRRVDSSQGPLTAVFVGPLVDRGAAQILLDRLRQDFQLGGMIVRYEIESL